ncbi:hypothetical protein [Neoaquamicrobium sediminum]|uniref:hypothetical protein n=1 Tax=Neoaquamicrobium sediminum TaxID=1849104 RepID=UPI001FD5A367|nr:hypothetical protein [Mesorhizobium sediminum]
MVSNDPVNGEYMRLVLRAPTDLLEQCRAGQFFHLLCPAIGGETPYLRRPMSIYGFYPEREELHFLYKVTGEGTRALFHLGPGDSLNVLGPLGQGSGSRPAGSISCLWRAASALRRLPHLRWKHSGSDATSPPSAARAIPRC